MLLRVCGSRGPYLGKICKLTYLGRSYTSYNLTTLVRCRFGHYNVVFTTQCTGHAIIIGGGTISSLGDLCSLLDNLFYTIKVGYCQTGNYTSGLYGVIGGQLCYFTQLERYSFHQDLNIRGRICILTLFVSNSIRFDQDQVVVTYCGLAHFGVCSSCQTITICNACVGCTTIAFTITQLGCQDLLNAQIGRDTSVLNCITWNLNCLANSRAMSIFGNDFTSLFRLYHRLGHLIMVLARTGDAIIDRGCNLKIQALCDLSGALTGLTNSKGSMYHGQSVVTSCFNQHKFGLICVRARHACSKHLRLVHIGCRVGLKTGAVYLNVGTLFQKQLGIALVTTVISVGGCCFIKDGDFVKASTQDGGRFLVICST